MVPAIVDHIFLLLYLCKIYLGKVDVLALLSNNILMLHTCLFEFQFLSVVPRLIWEFVSFFRVF